MLQFLSSPLGCATRFADNCAEPFLVVAIDAAAVHETLFVRRANFAQDVIESIHQNDVRVLRTSTRKIARKSSHIAQWSSRDFNTSQLELI